MAPSGVGPAALAPPPRVALVGRKEAAALSGFRSNAGRRAAPKNAAYSPLTHELHLDLSNGTRSLRASGGGGTRGAAMSYRELRNFKEIMATLTGPN